MSDRPNVLYVFTDQQAGGAMSCAGNDDLRTPAMDRLAAEGLRFSQAYCTQPLCSPCRASMFSGLMPQEAGVPRNGLPYNDRARGQELGRLMHAAGYECAYGGKWHIPEGSIPEGHGFANICGHNDDELAVACIDFLKRRHDKPFFLVAGFDNPHNICQWARNQPLPWGPVPEPPDVAACPNLPANFAIPAYEPEAIRLEQSRNAFAYPVTHFTEDDWRRYRYAYYRMVEKVDAEIGKILDALQAEGLADDTLVIFSSDHGDVHGAHHWNQKSLLYEEAVRVPLIVRAPDMKVRGAVDERHLASIGLDLMPTVCDYADVEGPAGLRGHSWRGVLEGRETVWRNELAVDAVFDGPANRPTLGRAVCTDRYKYVVYNWGKNREQLFDLENDPGELVDLSVESRYDDVVRDHRRRARRWGEAYDPQGYWGLNVPDEETR